MTCTALALTGVLFLLPTAQAQESLAPLEKYRRLAFPPKDENFTKGWEDRVLEENLLLSKGKGTFSKEKSLVFASALSDPAGYASALYGVSRKCLRWGGWVENEPTWFVIDKKGILTYAARPSFATPTSYVDDIDVMLEALKKAAR